MLLVKAARTLRDAGVQFARIEDVGSGASERPERDALMRAARRREINLILVWRLDRWGRSLADLVVTLKEMGELGVGFVSFVGRARSDHAIRPGDGRDASCLRRV